MNSNWFYSDGQQSFGPVSDELLTTMIQGGQILAGHAIMPEGSNAWQFVAASPFAAFVPQAIPRPRIQVTLRGTEYEVKPASKRFPAAKIAIAALVLTLIVAGSYYILSLSARKTIERIEGESMKVVKVTGGEAKPQILSDEPAAVWSGNSQMGWHNAVKDDVLTLAFPVKERGKQRLKAVLTLSHNYTLVTVALDGQAVRGSPFNLKHWGITVSDILDWGIHDLSVGDHELTIKFTPASTASRNFGFSTGLDYIQLEPPERSSVYAAAGANVALTARPSASYRKLGANPVTAINDGKVAAKSNLLGSSVPRHTWHPRTGGMEWAQLEWETPQLVSQCDVFWFADLGLPGGVCTAPFFWRVLYREESGAWVPVNAVIPAAQKDQWSVVKFPPVKTCALRLAVQCAAGFSAGVVEWKAIASDPKAVPNKSNTPLPDLFLGDLTPLYAQVGWHTYRASQYHEADLKVRVPRIAGKDADYFLWAHAESQIEFAIPEGYTRFKAVGFGPFDKRTNGPTHSQWIYEVRVDEKLFFKSKELRTYPNKEMPVDVTFPKGSRKITLLTHRNGVNDHHSFWGYPRFVASDDGAALPDKLTGTAPPPK